MSAYYTDEELREYGFLHLGRKVLISRKASIYNPESISIGDAVRIDDFCVLSAGQGGIELHSYIHIGPYSAIIGAGKVTLEDYSNISARVTIYSSNDDYSGLTMTNPMVPADYKNVRHAAVTIGRHVIVGCGAVVLPGVNLGEGCAVGALSLVNESYPPFKVVAGTPARVIKTRAHDLLHKEQLLKLANQNVSLS